MATTIESPYLTTAEAAVILRATPDYVARQCKAGNIKAINLKGQQGWRILPADLDAFTAGTKPARQRPTRTRKAAR